ncbi:MAG: ATP-binding cassette domain-containing protein [Gammaproteobacteria bacterium]|nr:ATP-binding cassette domain-containing protein [Gammaproteobacteria bacterium]MYG68175.1 ATP-binding cassette domain-containing protein [Gammaproteobacteria bacterium]
MKDTGPQYISIAELAARSGTAVPCAGNLPVRLDDPDSVWFIDQGAVNLFLIEFKDGVEQAAPQHLLRRDSGWLLPGVAPDVRDDGQDTTLSLMAKGMPGTMLKRLPASLLSQADPAELAEQADTWLNAITGTLSRFASPLPRPTALAEPGLAQTLSPSCTLSTRHRVVWVSKPSHGAVLFMDIVDQAELAEAGGAGETMLPLTRTNWITLFEETTLTGQSTETLAQQGTLLPALATFHAVAFTLERLNRRLAVVDDVNLERARTTSRRTAERVARQRLFNIYDQPIDREASVEDTALEDALRIIGRHEGIDFRIPARTGPADIPIGLVDVLDASGVRARRVRFKAEGTWWRGDSNAMLVFRPEDGRPVALLPGMFGRYREYDPATKRSARISADRASALGEEAWMFYRPLPSGNVKPADLLKIALHGSAADLLRLVIAGLPGGLIKLLPALALGFVAHEATAGGNVEALYAMAVALAGLGVLGALLHLLQGTAMMRLEGRAASRVEAAFWDRLMRLPPSILHRQPAGDLAMSGMTFQNLRDGLQGVVADSFLSIIFLLPSFGIIFFYDATLGSIALAFSLASLLITAVIGWSQISPYGRMISATRRVAGQLFQIVGGITKLRVENAEGSAFAIWARGYREQKRAELELGALEGHSRAFGAALPFLAAGVLLFAVMSVGDRNVPVGDFLVVYTVFIVFQTAIARLGESLGTVAAMLPAFDQMRPLLTAVPEAEIEGEPVEYLGGDILFDHISFRYDPDGPLILDGVTIRARPGEFIAIAGESGAGKSTLFRLALGIDRPTAGAVYYDGRDLRHLNLRQVRRKIGTVPQSVGLHPQDLWDNLVSHHDGVENEEVWTATRVAEVEDEIRGMPMGMMTMVGASGSVLSGGESQRVTIARSVIGNPRIMLFDEATNWLDNENQAKVMRNLTTLTATRIVIAHRLSTLEQADRIYVLQAGRVVQSGSFDELMEVDGVFKELVKRQVA